MCWNVTLLETLFSITLQLLTLESISETWPTPPPPHSVYAAPSCTPDSTMNHKWFVPFPQGEINLSRDKKESSRRKNNNHHNKPRHLIWIQRFWLVQTTNKENGENTICSNFAEEKKKKPYFTNSSGFISSQASSKAEADNNVITLVMICIRYIMGNNNAPHWMQSVQLLIFLNVKSATLKLKRDILYLFSFLFGFQVHRSFDAE